MPTPVLIAARNEAAQLGRTLEALPRSVEPIVIPNGCTDNTAEVAAQFGATVLAASQEGKLPALQAGFHYLGERALAPLITLDADSYPLIGRAWLPSMLRARRQLNEQHPACIVGPAVYRDNASLLTAGWRNLGAWRQQIRTRHETAAGFYPGRNMLLHFRNQATLQAALDLSHIWPAEDVALKDVVLAAGGEVAKSIDPRAIVMTSGDRYPGLLYRLLRGREVSTQWCFQSYAQDATSDAISYSEYLAQQPSASADQQLVA